MSITLRDVFAEVVAGQSVRAFYLLGAYGAAGYGKVAVHMPGNLSHVRRDRHDVLGVVVGESASKASAQQSGHQ